jgi:superfamily I DNA/RNA helicase
MCEEAGIAWTRPADEKRLPHFFDVEAPALLNTAADRLGSRYDAIVVDEGQDFLTQYYTGIEKLLEGGDQGVLYVFADSRQDVFRRAPQYPTGLTGPYHLPFNCRNTVAISRLLERLSGDRVPFAPEAPHGEEPVLHRCRTRHEEKDAVRGIIATLCGKEGLSPGRIAILSCRRADNSILGGEEEIAGFRLAHNIYPPPKGSILVTSLLRYKGLEADAVIVTDIDPALSQASSMHLYVAASRAKLRLFMVGTDEAIELLEKAKAEAR